MVAVGVDSKADMQNPAGHYLQSRAAGEDAPVSQHRQCRHRQHQPHYCRCFSGPPTYHREREEGVRVVGKAVAPTLMAEVGQRNGNQEQGDHGDGCAVVVEEGVEVLVEVPGDDCQAVGGTRCGSESD